MSAPSCKPTDTPDRFTAQLFASTELVNMQVYSPELERGIRSLRGVSAAYTFGLPGGTWRLGVGFTFLYDYNSVEPNPEQSE